MHSIMFIVLTILLLGVVRGLAPLDPRWKLTWNDEFDGTSIDTTKWSVVDYLGYTFAGEAEYNSFDHVSVADGKLILKSNNTAYWGQSYTSGKVHTSGKWDATYGRYEVYASVPTAAGMWPAHWLVSDYRCWPYGMEIDILESIGAISPHTAYGTVHLGKSCGDNNGQEHTANYNFSVGYHLFAVEWYPDHIAWFVDDYNYGNVSAATAYSNGPITFDPTPHYMILNTAIGASGSWPGPPDPNQVWPLYHMIDYVRYYTWEPCVSGCGSNGCCEPTTQTCKCDAGFLGANCEYQNSGLYVNTFDALVSGDWLSNGTDPRYPAPYVEYLSSNAKFSNGIMSLVMAPCGSDCDAGASYSSATWNTGKYYSGGTFEFIMQMDPIKNGRMFIVFTGGLGGAPESFQMQFDTTNSRVYSQTYGPGNLASGIADSWVGFNVSDGFHSYKIVYVPTQSVILYCDGVVVGNLTTTYPYALTSAFSVSLSLQGNPSYWGAIDLTAPAYVNVNSFTYTPPVQKAVCSAQATSSWSTTSPSTPGPTSTSHLASSSTSAASTSGSQTSSKTATTSSSSTTSPSTPGPTFKPSPTSTSLSNTAGQSGSSTTKALSENGTAALAPLLSMLFIIFALL